jgi:hypothetical protein
VVTVWQFNNTCQSRSTNINYCTVDTWQGRDKNDMSYTDSEFRPKGTRATSVDSDGRDYRRDRIADLHEERRASKRVASRHPLYCVLHCHHGPVQQYLSVPYGLNSDMTTESPRVNSARMRTFIGASHPIRLIGKVVNVGLRPSITSIPPLSIWPGPRSSLSLSLCVVCR